MYHNSMVNYSVKVAKKDEMKMLRDMVQRVKSAAGVHDAINKTIEDAYELAMDRLRSDYGEDMAGFKESSPFISAV